MKVEYTHELGPRSVLEVGSKFRVTAGPYWITESGDRLRMRARGVMTFLSKTTFDDGRVYIEARSEREGDCILHIAGKRSNPFIGDALVCRPYRIVGRVGVRRRRRVQSRDRRKTK